MSEGHVKHVQEVFHRLKARVTTHRAVNDSGCRVNAGGQPAVCRSADTGFDQLRFPALLTEKKVSSVLFCRKEPRGTRLSPSEKRRVGKCERARMRAKAFGLSLALKDDESCQLELRKQ